MRCTLCRNLEQAFEARRREFVEASSMSSFLVSKRFAAYSNVEMERALMELQEHRYVCHSAMKDTAPLPAAAPIRLAPLAQPLAQKDALRTSPIGTAA
jgi:hypothetical protein